VEGSHAATEVVLNPQYTFDVEKRVLTPAEAERYIEEYAYDKNRNGKIYPDHVNTLYEEMMAGRFVPTTIILVKLGDRLYMVNSNHTLRAQVRAGATYEYAVLTYHVEKESDVHWLYTVIDTNKKRNIAEAVGADPRLEEAGITSEMASWFCRAFALIQRKFRYKGDLGAMKNPTYRLDKLLECKAIILIYANLIQDVERKSPNWQMITCMDFCAVMIYAMSLDEHRSKVSRFIEDYISNDLSKATTHGALLKGDLGNFSMKASNADLDKHHRLQRIVAEYLNAYVEGRQAPVGVRPEPKSPLVILGHDITS
jgi:hypothetical protein